jgi:hypothetical protein
VNVPEDVQTWNADISLGFMCLFVIYLTTMSVARLLGKLMKDELDVIWKETVVA